MGTLLFVAFFVAIFSLTFLSLSRYSRGLSEKKRVTMTMNAMWLTPRKKEVDRLYHRENASSQIADSVDARHALGKADSKRSNEEKIQK